MGFNTTEEILYNMGLECYRCGKIYLEFGSKKSSCKCSEKIHEAGFILYMKIDNQTSKEITGGS